MEIMFLAKSRRSKWMIFQTMFVFLQPLLEIDAFLVWSIAPKKGVILPLQKPNPITTSYK